MLDRLQRYLDSFSRIPSDEEVQDALRMSRRGFFGATAALAAAPLFAEPAYQWKPGVVTKDWAFDIAGLKPRYHVVLVSELRDWYQVESDPQIGEILDEMRAHPESPFVLVKDIPWLHGFRSPF